MTKDTKNHDQNSFVKQKKQKIVCENVTNHRCANLFYAYQLSRLYFKSETEI